MAAAGFIGFLLISAGPPLVIWCSFIAQKSFLVLLALARWIVIGALVIAVRSAFYWLVALLLTALLFRAFVPLPERAAIYGIALLVAVTIQEASRYLAFLIHRQIVQQLHLASRHLHLPKVTLGDRRLLALAQGVGHALAQNSFLYYSFLPLAAGKGTKYIDACPRMSYFLAAGLLSLAFFLLHCFSMVIAFHGYESKNALLVSAVAGLHVIAAFTTLISMASGGCVVAVWLTSIQGCLALLAAASICYRYPVETGDTGFQEARPGHTSSAEL